MALKTYNPVTLNGNFNEDRAPPLGNGNVIADYGRHDARGGLPLSSTHAASFAAPPQPGASRPRQLEHKFSQGGQTKMLLKMTRLDSWHEAARPRDSKLTEPGNFTSLVPHLREGDTHKSSEWRSTTQHAFGVGHSPGERAELSASMRATDAPWVRGRPGLRQEKGKSTSGIMGEVLKDTPDEPQVSAQRLAHAPPHTPPHMLPRAHTAAAAAAAAAAACARRHQPRRRRTRQRALALAGGCVGDFQGALGGDSGTHFDTGLGPPVLLLARSANFSLSHLTYPSFSSLPPSLPSALLLTD